MPLIKIPHLALGGAILMAAGASALIYNTASMVEDGLKPSLEKLSKTNAIGTLVSVDYKKGFLSSHAKSEWLQEDGEYFTLVHDVSHFPMSAHITTTLKELKNTKGFKLANPNEPLYVVQTEVDGSGNSLSTVALQDLIATNPGEESFIKGVSGFIETTPDEVTYAFNVKNMEAMNSGKGMKAENIRFYGVTDYDFVSSKTNIQADSLMVNSDQNEVKLGKLLFSVDGQEMNNGYKFSLASTATNKNASYSNASAFDFTRMNLDLSLIASGKGIVDSIKNSEGLSEEEVLRTLLSSSPLLKVDAFDIDYHSHGNPYSYKTKGKLSLDLPADIDPVLFAIAPMQALKFMKGQFKFDLPAQLAQNLAVQFNMPTSLVGASGKSTTSDKNVILKLDVLDGGISLNSQKIL